DRLLVAALAVAVLATRRRLQVTLFVLVLVRARAGLRRPVRFPRDALVLVFHDDRVLRELYWIGSDPRRRRPPRAAGCVGPRGRRRGWRAQCACHRQKRLNPRLKRRLP